MEMLDFAAGYAAGKAQGGGGEAVLINKSVSSNGTYLASSDSADGFKKVTVSVPNSYAAGDEGKVVSNGALVSQTAHAKVTQNGTIDTTLNNSVEVDVSGGGTLVTKNITQNGTYYASSDNADGYSSVTVSVSGGGGRQEAWDFTGETPTVGTVQTLPATAKNISFGSSGAVFDAATDHIDFVLALNGMTIEVDVAEMDLTADANRRFIMFTTEKGFIYRNTGYWSFYGGTWATDSTISDGDYFAGSTVKVYIDANGYWHIYKDGVLVYEPNKALSPTAGFMIGSGTSGINSATISAVRISW